MGEKRDQKRAIKRHKYRHNRGYDDADDDDPHTHVDIVASCGEIAIVHTKYQTDRVVHANVCLCVIL